MSYGIDETITNQTECNLCWNTIFVSTTDIQAIKNVSSEVRKADNFTDQDRDHVGFIQGEIGNLSNFGVGYNALGFGTSVVPYKIASITPPGVICLF